MKRSGIMLRSIVLFGCWLALAGTAQAQPQGRAVFEGKGNCWTCHGKNGSGTPLGPNLTDDEWLNIDGSLDSIRAIVLHGVPKPRKYPAPMPPQGGAKLSSAEIDAVAAYVFGLRAGERTPAGRDMQWNGDRPRRRSIAALHRGSPTLVRTRHGRPLPRCSSRIRGRPAPARSMAGRYASGPA
jgi:mono/diheme cytochrome c family protein